MDEHGDVKLSDLAIETQLARLEGNTVRRLTRAEYWEEQAKMMESWRIGWANLKAGSSPDRIGLGV
jgi:hypothetical protein